jgi:hypothetical protein
MRTFYFLMAPVAVLLISSCKTTEPRETALDGKRADIQALVARFADQYAAGVVNWTIFQDQLREDAVVERMNLTELELCLDQLLSHSGKVKSMHAALGCDSLHEKAKSLSGQDVLDYFDKHHTLVTACDSLSVKLASSFEQAFVPCRKLFVSQ